MKVSTLPWLSGIRLHSGNGVTHTASSTVTSDPTTSGKTMVIAKGELRKLGGDRRGVKIRCNSGCVWITQERDGQDIILQPGEIWMVNQRGLVLIEALEAAIVRIS